MPGSHSPSGIHTEGTLLYQKGHSEVPHTVGPLPGPLWQGRHTPTALKKIGVQQMQTGPSGPGHHSSETPGLTPISSGASEHLSPGVTAQPCARCGLMCLKGPARPACSSVRKSCETCGIGEQRRGEQAWSWAVLTKPPGKAPTSPQRHIH